MKAADLSQIPREFRQRVWTTEQGLPDNTVNAILQTRDGYIWLGTPGGLARFDGLSFTVFNQANSPVPEHEARLVLAEDRDSSLWVGSKNGLIRYHDGVFTRYTTSDGLWSDEVRVLHVGKSGILWIGTSGGLNQLSNGTLVRRSTHDWIPDEQRLIVGLWEDEVGALWIAGRNSLQKRNIATWGTEVVFRPSDGHRFGPVYQDTSGDIWVATRFHLMQYRNEDWVYHPNYYESETGAVSFIIRDSRGSLWFGAGVVGLGRHSKGLFTHFDSDVGLPYYGIMCAHEDRSGNLLLGRYDGGLVCWQPKRFTTYDARDGLPSDDVRATCASRDGGVWIGTEAGLCHFYDGRFSMYPREGGQGRPIRSIVEDSAGNVWIGTLGAGVERFRDGRFTNYTLPNGVEGNKVRSLTIGKDGALWIGTALGLHQLYNERLTTFVVTNGILDSEIWAIHQDRKGNIWVGVNGVVCLSAAGLATAANVSVRTNPSLLEEPSKEDRDVLGGREHRVSIVAPDDYSLFTTTNGLSSNNIWAMHGDSDGVLWVGTESGLNRLENGRLTRFTTREGLFSNRIEEILEDKVGNFWIAWDRGVFRVRKTELNDLAAGRASSVHCIAYDETDGLPEARINGRKSHPASCTTPEGRLWIPTTKGVVVIDPKELDKHEVPPSVTIEQVRANDKIVFDNLFSSAAATANRSAGSLFASGPTPASAGSGPFRASTAEKPQPSQADSQSTLGVREAAPLRHFDLAAGDGGVLRFQYAAPTLVAPERVRFKHRLEGHNSEWISVGTERVAYYTNLRPGNYRFRVLACNHHGIWNDAGASFAFTLAPNYWETATFRIAVAVLIVLAGSAAGWGLYRWRLGFVSRMHELEKNEALAQERKRIARDLHDQIGSQLTRLSLMADLPVSPGDKPSLRPEPPIGVLARQAMRSLREVAWTMDPVHDTLEHLVDHLCRQTRDYLIGTEVSLRLEMPEAIPPASVNASTRHHVALVVGEAVCNALKHSHATAIRLHFSHSEKYWSITVADNGQGFDPVHRAEAGNGLQNMRTRVAEAGGHFKIESQPGAGTLLVIEMPF